MLRNFKYTFFFLLVLLGYAQIDLHAQTFPLDSLDKNLKQLGNYLFNRNHDTNYIANYNDKLAVKLLANTKINFFQLQDNASNNNIIYRPNRGINLGFGFSYRWIALDLAFSSRLQEKNELSDKNFFDFQGRVYSSRHFMETKLQYYYGYKMEAINSTVLENEDSGVIREDIRTISLGLQYLYAIKYDKFSFKAPFVMSEIQLKSAGSPIVGADFNMYILDSDSSMIPGELEGELTEKLGFTDFNTLSLSVKFGYMYTFVVKKHFFLSVGIIPGLVYSTGDYYTESRERIKAHLNYSIKGISTLGYNGKLFFSGIQLITDTHNVKVHKDAYTQLSNGKITLFLGYRFDVG